MDRKGRGGGRREGGREGSGEGGATLCVKYYCLCS